MTWGCFRNWFILAVNVGCVVLQIFLGRYAMTGVNLFACSLVIWTLRSRRRRLGSWLR